jgi:predicted RNA-binding Zn-ribbon protein involved in translation (DUF1610 family)
MSNITLSKYYAIDICAGCKKSLTREERFSSNGVCPYCGHSSGYSMCDTNRLVIRKITEYNGLFKANKVTYEGKDEKAKTWLLNNHIRSL